MWMVPIRSRLVWDRKLIQERISRNNWALRDSNGTICKVSLFLEKSMPMLVLLDVEKMKSVAEYTCLLTILVLRNMVVSVNWSITLRLKWSPFMKIYYPHKRIKESTCLFASDQRSRERHMLWIRTCKDSTDERLNTEIKYIKCRVNLRAIEAIRLQKFICNVQVGRGTYRSIDTRR